MNIHIADGNEVFRLGLRKHIEALYHSCRVTDTDIKAIATDSINWNTMDLIILHKADDHYRLEDLLRKLKSLIVGPKILILSDQIDFYQAKNLFALGVKGYVDRGASLNDITQTIREILKGKVYLEPSLWIEYITNHAPTHIFPGLKTGKPLTGKELEIANYLMKGFKTNEISKLLNKSPTTISTQKANIYKKLEVRNIVELLQCMNRSI